MTSAAEDLRDQAERSVLGACLLAEPVIRSCVDLLEARDFYRPQHTTIYAVIVGMWSQGLPVDPLTVTAYLADTNVKDLQRVGGAPYLHRLVAEVHHIGSATQYARIVAEQSRRRRLQEIADVLSRASVTDDGAAIGPMLSLAAQDLDHLMTGRTGRDPVETLLGELMSSADLSSLPALDPLIPGILYRDSLTWLAGRPARGKTLVALDMAGSIGTGMPWQGYPVAQGEVWYVIAEGIRGLRDRVRAWESLAGRPMTGVQFLPHPVQANEVDQWRALCRAARRRHPSMIILDTQARISVGLDENDGRDMGLLVERLEELRQSSSACVLTLHHTPRGGNHVRGHSAIEGAAQTIIMIAKEGDTLTLHNTEDEGGKQKDAEPFAPIHLRITPAADHVALTMTDRAQSVDTGSTVAQQILIEWWEMFGDDEVSKSALMKAGLCSSDRTLYRFLSRFAKEGTVAKIKKGRGAVYRLANDPAES